MTSYHPNNNINSLEKIDIDKNHEDGANIDHLNSLNNNKNVLESYANQPPQFQTIYIQTKQPVVNEGGTVSFILFILGFLFPLCWIVNLIHIKSSNKRSKKYSIISIILFAVFSVIIIIAAATSK